MELELGLALPNSNLIPNRGFDLNDDAGAFACKKKRGYCEAFGVAEMTALPLFVHEENSDGGGSDGCQTDGGNLCNKKVVVGWPPIKRTMSRINACGEDEGLLNTSNNDGSGSARRGKCVKVKMEGVGIGRKVDLSLHHSYHSLLYTLTEMFPKQRGEMAMETPKLGEYRHEYTVTYEDEEGDWLLLGDVPWQTFIRSAKRLKILS